MKKMTGSILDRKREYLKLDISHITKIKHKALRYGRVDLTFSLTNGKTRNE